MQRPWTKEDIAYLADHYHNTPNPILSIHMKRTINSLTWKAYLLGLRKSDEFLNSELSGRHNLIEAGKQHRFQKGLVPHNKGKKMPSEVYEKVKRTMFRKGNLPHNTKYDGALSIRDGYYYIRLAKAEWKELHRHLWEKENGEIPEGFNVVFKDGNRKNCVLDNLELISNEELMRRNTFLKYPEDIREIIKAKRVLTRIINQHEKYRDNNG